MNAAKNQNSQEILGHVTSLLARDGGMEANAAELVEYLGSALDWGWVAVWKVLPEDRCLRSISVWHDSSPEAAELREFTLKWRPGLGEGAPGMAWKKETPIASVDVVADMALPRSLLTSKAGLLTGLWTPIRGREKVHGVLELMRAQHARPDQQQIALAANLAERIGLMMERSGS